MSTERISISLDAALLAALDGSLARSGHANRSEAIRDLIRGRMVSEAAPEQIVAGSLTVVFDHQQRSLSDRLVGAAHDHHHIVLSTLHVHLDHDTCMEVSALRGRRQDLEHYCEHVLGIKGVLHGELVLTPASVQG